MIVAEASSCREAVKRCRNGIEPQVGLVGFELPDSDGVATIQHLLAEKPTMRLLLLTEDEDEHLAIEAIRAGARAVVSQGSRPEVVIDAIESVCSGGAYLSTTASQRIMRHIQEVVAGPISRIKLLRTRELQVVRLVGQGMQNKEIAAVLQIGVETVRSYRKRAMRILGAKNGAQLTKICIHEGIIFRTGRSNILP